MPVADLAKRSFRIEEPRQPILWEENQAMNRSALRWNRRRQLGIFPAFARSFIEVLVSPHRAWPAAGREPDLAGALLFALLASLVGSLVLALASTFPRGLPAFNPAKLPRHLLTAFALINFGVLANFVTIAFVSGIVYLLRGMRLSYKAVFCTFCYTFSTMHSVYFVFLIGVAVLWILAPAVSLGLWVKPAPILFGVWLLYAGTGRARTIRDNFIIPREKTYGTIAGFHLPEIAGRVAAAILFYCTFRLSEGDRAENGPFWLLYYELLNSGIW